MAESAPEPVPESSGAPAAEVADVADLAPAAAANASIEAESRGASLDGVPEEARGVIELFSGQLAAISFPDVDATVLERHAAAVQAERRAVEEARAALETATIELAKRTEELTVLARRGLAYAKIYAAAHPEKQELMAGLSRLEARERAPKLREDGSPAPRRGRPPKAPRPELPFAASERDVSATSDGEDGGPARTEEERESLAAASAREEEEVRDAFSSPVEEDEAMESEPVLERDE